MKFSKTLLQKLEHIVSEAGYKVRYEKGNFNSGYCMVDEQNVIVINKFYDTEGRVHVLRDILATLPIEEKKLDTKSAHFLKSFLKETL